LEFSGLVKETPIVFIHAPGFGPSFKAQSLIAGHAVPRTPLMRTGIREFEHPTVPILLISAAFEVYHSIKIGFREGIDRATATTDYRDIMRRATKTAKLSASDNRLLIKDATLNFSCHTSLPF